MSTSLLPSTEKDPGPIPDPISSSWTSFRRQGVRLMEYCESPSRVVLRVIATSLKSTGRWPSELSKTAVTSPRAAARRVGVPAKTSSSRRVARRVRVLCSPRQ